MVDRPKSVIEEVFLVEGEEIDLLTSSQQCEIPSGHPFVRYATAMLALWDEAREKMSHDDLVAVARIAKEGIGLLGIYHRQDVLQMMTGPSLGTVREMLQVPAADGAEGDGPVFWAVCSYFVEDQMYVSIVRMYATLVSEDETGDLN